MMREVEVGVIGGEGGREDSERGGWWREARGNEEGCRPGSGQLSRGPIQQGTGRKGMEEWRTLRER